MIQVEPGVTAPVDAVMMPMETAMSGAGCLSMFNSAGATSGKRFVRTAKPAAGSSLNVSTTCTSMYHDTRHQLNHHRQKQSLCLVAASPVCNLICCIASRPHVASNSSAGHCSSKKHPPLLCGFDFRTQMQLGSLLLHFSLASCLHSWIAFAAPAAARHCLSLNCKTHFLWLDCCNCSSFWRPYLRTCTRRHANPVHHQNPVTFKTLSPAKSCHLKIPVTFRITVISQA